MAVEFSTFVNCENQLALVLTHHSDNSKRTCPPSASALSSRLIAPHPISSHPVSADKLKHRQLVTQSDHHSSADILPNYPANPRRPATTRPPPPPFNSPIPPRPTLHPHQQEQCPPPRVRPRRRLTIPTSNSSLRGYRRTNRPRRLSRRHHGCRPLSCRLLSNHCHPDRSRLTSSRPDRLPALVTAGMARETPLAHGGEYRCAPKLFTQ